MGWDGTGRDGMGATFSTESVQTTAQPPPPPPPAPFKNSSQTLLASSQPRYLETAQVLNIQEY